MLLPFEICMFLPFDQNRVEKAGYALEVTSFKLNEKVLYSQFAWFCSS